MTVAEALRVAEEKLADAGVDTPKVDFWRFKDGKAVEFYDYYATARVFAAASP